MRIGNAAAGQFQLDVYGEVDRRALTRPGGSACRPARGPGDAALRSWTSRVALARARRRHLGGARPAAALHALEGDGLGRVRPRRRASSSSASTARSSGGERVRDEIHAEVCEQGFDAERSTFMQSYGSTELDASAAADPAGRLPAADRPARSRAPSRPIERELLPRRLRACATTPTSGTSTACRRARAPSWPARSGSPTTCALIGRRDEARAMFERLLALRNDVGLLAEEYDPQARAWSAISRRRSPIWRSSRVPPRFRAEP